MSDLGPQARALIEASRGDDEPSAEDRARVGRKLAEQLPAFAASAGLAKLDLDGAHAAAQGKAAASASGLLGSGLAKVATLSVAALLAGSAAVVLMRDRVQSEVRAPAGQPSSPAPLAVEQAAPPPSVLPPAVVEVARRTAEPQERFAAHSRPVRRAAPAERAVAQRQQVVTSAERVRAEEESPSDAVQAIEAPRQDVRVQQVPSLPKAEQAAAVAAPRIAEVRRGPDPEAALLAAARAAFEQGEPERTLELTQRHAARFPSSTLAEERVALQGLALCALHRFDEGLTVLRGARAAHSPLHTAALRACNGARPR